MWWRKHDNMFSRFDRVPACDRQTDGQTSSLYLLRASALLTHVKIIIMIDIIIVCWKILIMQKLKSYLVYLTHLRRWCLKPGFHYPSWRSELTARVDGEWKPVTRQHGPSTRVVETGLYLQLENSSKLPVSSLVRTWVSAATIDVNRSWLMTRWNTWDSQVRDT